MKTKTITSLDELKPGMKRCIQEPSVSYEVVHVGAERYEPWIIAIKHRGADTPTNFYFNDNRVGRISLNQEVEVQE